MNEFFAFANAHPNVYGALFILAVLAVIWVPSFLFGRNADRINRSSWWKIAAGGLCSPLLFFMAWAAWQDDQGLVPAFFFGIGFLVLLVDGLVDFFGIRVNGKSSPPSQYDFQRDELGGPLASRSRAFNRHLVENQLGPSDFEAVRKATNSGRKMKGRRVYKVWRPGDRPPDLSPDSARRWPEEQARRLADQAAWDKENPD